jgi:pimeloyl-ACP methyl ester carboxylesterase
VAETEIGEVAFGYDEAGSGPAVLLVHAGLADRQMWEHQFQVLRQRHRVIRYDWRGYGESGDAVGEVARHEDVLALMDALGVDEAALVGSSCGGAHVLDAALAAPRRVTALALICSGLSGHQRSAQTLELMAARVRSAAPADRLRRYRKPGGRQRGSGRRGSDGGGEPSAVWSHRAKERLPEVRVPTLVINGLAEVAGIQEVSGLLASGISGARRMDLASTGHLPPLERPAQVTGALAELLAAA